MACVCPCHHNTPPPGGAAPPGANVTGWAPVTREAAQTTRENGAAMTTSAEFTTIPQLRAEYGTVRTLATESMDELAGYAARHADDAALFTRSADELDARAAAWDAIAGQLRGAGHDQQTCADAAAMTEALRSLATASRVSAERCAALTDQITATQAAAEPVAAAAQRGIDNIQRNLSGLIEHAGHVQASAPLNQYAPQ